MVVQSTWNGPGFADIVRKLSEKYYDVRAINTICTDTKNRQTEVEQLAHEVEVMVVVGGKTSANTKHLAELAAVNGARSYHVEGPDELDARLVRGRARSAGLMSGASTPGWLVDRVADRMDALAAGADSLEAALERAVSRFDDGSPVSEQIRYHFGFGAGERRGKRLRSRLVLEVAAEEGVPADEVMDAACAVEILHEFSLVHDDIEDGDRLRRGRETTWARFGLAHGINAGDALCAVAYLTLWTAPPPARPAPLSG